MSEMNEVKVVEIDDLCGIINFLLTLRLPNETRLKEDFCSKLSAKNHDALLLEINKNFFSSEKSRDEEDINSFWSFRGQRDSRWGLGINYRFGDNKTIFEISPETGFDGFGTLLEQFKTRMKEFRHQEQEINHLDEKDEWDWLFYAQHHRMYTRLLDWTSNPLVAIYFAVEDIGSEWNKEKANPNEDKKEYEGGAVWALKAGAGNFFYPNILPNKFGDPRKQLESRQETGEMKRLESKDWFMINPAPITKRIARQSAKFTFHPGDEAELKQPFDDLIRQHGNGQLIKIKIKDKHIKLIRQQLGIMNIHHASLFPSPTGVAEFVNREWPKIGKY
ncbi:MAG: FRG domain-containing protein [Treponema sp.]|jgi:hypothetical protein|nr:FRG domain-containing protein [Treponema sp.]